MNRKALSLTGLVAALALASSAQANMDNGHDNDHDKGNKIHVPIVDENNPCTKGYDSLDGKITLHTKLKKWDHKKQLYIDGKGHASDAWGKDYKIVGDLDVKLGGYASSVLFFKAKLIKKDGRDGHDGHDGHDNNYGDNGSDRGEGHDNHDGKHDKDDDRATPKLLVLIHVNEHGHVVKADVKGIQCEI